MNLLLLIFIIILNALSVFTILFINGILKLLLVLHLEHLLMGDVVLLSAVCDPPDDLLTKRLSSLGSHLLKVLVETIGEENLLSTFVVSQGILSP